MVITVPDLSELFLKAIEQPQELTPAEHIRFRSIVSHSLASFEMALDYHGDGLLSDEHIERYTQGIFQLFENPVVLEWWDKEGRLIFSQRVYDLLDRRRADQTS